MRIRPTSLLILLASATASASAQEVSQSAPARPTAKWRLLEDQFAARLAELKVGDTKANAELFAARVAELQAFAAEFPAAAETNQAWLEIAQVGAALPEHAEAARMALAKFDLAMAELGAGITAVQLAGSLDLEARRADLLELVVARARSVEERMELVTALKYVLGEAVRASRLLTETEAAATSDEDKAAILYGKAGFVRYEDRRDTEGYQAALLEAVGKYPATAAGKLAAAKLAASRLGPGSDPVPFTVDDLDGKPVSPRDYQGKVLLLDFWATWCGPCMAELPKLLELYGECHDQGFEIIGISLDRSTARDKLAAAVRERGMTWRQVCDGRAWKGEVPGLYDVQAIPFTVLIGKNGKVIGTGLRGRKLAEAVKEALTAG